MTTTPASFASSLPETRSPKIRTVRTPVRMVSVALVAVVVFGLWALRLRGPIDLRYDAGVYYVLGTSLATGDGYRIISEPGAPQAVQYPPLLPAIVAVHQKLLGTSDAAVVGPWLRGTFAVLFLAYAFSVLALARAHLGERWALIATLLCLGHANTYLLSDLLFTELPFTFVCVLFALLLSTQRFADWERARGVAGYLLATAAFLLRTAGVALLAAWVAEAAFQRRWKQAAVRALLAFLPVAAWQGYVHHVRGGEAYRHPAYEYQRAPYQFYNVSYGENLSLKDPFQPELGHVTATQMIGRFWASAGRMPIVLGESVSEVYGFWRAALRGDQETGNAYRPVNLFARSPLYLLSALIIAGGFRFFKRRSWVMISFPVLSAVLIFTTPWPDQIGRYFAPLTPFLAIACALGGAGLMAYFYRRRRSSWTMRFFAIATTAFFGWVLALQAVTAGMVFKARHYEPSTFVPGRGLDYPRWFYYDATWSEWEKAAHWVGQQAERTDVVVTTSPHLLYIWENLKAVMPPMENRPDECRRLIADVGANWVIIDDFKFLDISRRYALPAIAADPTHWRLVKSFGKTLVYQRVHEATSSDYTKMTGSLAKRESLAWQTVPRS